MTNKSFSSLAKWQVAVIVIVTYFALDKLYVGSTSRNLVNVLAGDGPSLLRHIIRVLLHYPGPYILVPAFVTALIVGRKNVLHVWGFDKMPWRGLGFAFLCTLPLPLVYTFAYPISETSTLLVRTLNSAVLPGISEEVLFRCFLFGVLFKVAKWGFLPAAMLGAVIFGGGHIYQGHALLDSLGVFGITAVAALWWAWVYVEWDYNPWVPIGFHVFMNGWFVLFTVSETAMLPIVGEIARASVVVISIAVTLVIKRRNGGRTIVGHLWFKGRLQQ